MTLIQVSNGLTVFEECEQFHLSLLSRTSETLTREAMTIIGDEMGRNLTE